MSFAGILMLDTQFPRPVGDIGNPQTFARLGIDVRYVVVQSASPRRVVRQQDVSLLPAFIHAAQQLAAQGASLVATSCGFLAQHHQALQAAVAIPVLSSALLWLPRLASAGAGASTVLTIDPLALTVQHLVAVNADPQTPWGGVAEGCEFQTHILGNRRDLDLVRAQADVVAAARKLLDCYPGTCNIVLECTNMAPYSHAIEAATGRRVEHIMSLIEALWTH
jgi:hypothetical protein